MEERTPDFKEMVIESAENFSDQFDPGSASFHNGDPTPVPMGGDRVPSSMPTAYNPEGSFKDTPMDPQYYLIIEARSFLLEFKKVLGQVCPAVEAILRAHKLRVPAKRQAALIERQSALLQVLENARLMNAQLMSYGDFMPNYSEMVQEVFMRATLDYTDKANIAEFMAFMTCCAQRVFKDSQNFMQMLKTLN
jgi:hypothetical protein